MRFFFIVKFGFIEMILQAPDRAVNALSGARHAHFEGFLHRKNK